MDRSPSKFTGPQDPLASERVFDPEVLDAIAPAQYAFIVEQDSAEKARILHIRGLASPAALGLQQIRVTVLVDVKEGDPMQVAGDLVVDVPGLAGEKVHHDLTGRLAVVVGVEVKIAVAIQIVDAESPLLADKIRL